VPQPKTLSPLILRDPTGDELTLNYWPGNAGQAIGGPVTATVRRAPGATEKMPGVPAAILTREQLRQVIRWMAEALGETPMLAAQPDFFRVPDADGDVYFIANHDGHSCWFCHQPISQGAICERIVFPSVDTDVRPAPDEWAHDGCRPKPGQVVVLEVEGRPAPMHSSHPATMDICMGSLDENGKCSDCGRVFT
jgi:hypothetical protein